MDSIPQPLVVAGVSSARDLDVRPILAQGGDPFGRILRAAQALGPAEALHLVVGFEPRPLYATLGGLGLAHHTERTHDVFHVWFYRAGQRPGAASPSPERVPLLPVVELDVRGMEPPNPMMTILERLAELGPGARLRVHHHREPVHLYERLRLRGYAARTERRGEGDYLVHIEPEWASCEERG